VTSTKSVLKLQVLKEKHKKRFKKLIACNLPFVNIALFVTYIYIYTYIINLNGVKLNESVLKCSSVKFQWEEVKCRQV